MINHRGTACAVAVSLLLGACSSEGGDRHGHRRPARRGGRRRPALLPDAVATTCTRAGDYDHLSISPTPDDPRPVGLLLTPQLLPFLGLHVQDAYLALGNLLDLVTAQAAAFAS